MWRLVVPSAGQRGPYSLPQNLGNMRSNRHCLAVQCGCNMGRRTAKITVNKWINDTQQKRANMNSNWWTTPGQSQERIKHIRKVTSYINHTFNWKNFWMTKKFLNARWNNSMRARTIWQRTHGASNKKNKGGANISKKRAVIDGPPTLTTK